MAHRSLGLAALLMAGPAAGATAGATQTGDKQANGAAADGFCAFSNIFGAGAPPCAKPHPPR